MMKLYFAALMFMVALVLAGTPPLTQAFADTDNPSVASTDYQVLVMPIIDTYTGSSTKVGVMKFRAHWPMRVLTGHTAVRSTDNKAARVQVRAVYSNGTTVFSSLSSVGGQLVSDAVGKNVTDETDIRIDIIGPGLGRTARDITLDWAVKRR